MFDSHVAVGREDLSRLIQQTQATGACLMHTPEEFLTPHTDLRRFSSASFLLTEGVEIPFDAATQDRYALLLAGKRADYLVNSVLRVDGQRLDDMEYYTSQHRDDAYRRYLERVLDSLDAPFAFSALGPLTSPSRYAFYPAPNIEYREFPELLDCILLRAIYTEKALEVSTAAWAVLNDLMPSSSILARYRELGGTRITLASQAYRPALCGQHFAAAREKLLALGFDRYSVYVEQQPTEYPL